MHLGWLKAHYLFAYAILGSLLPYVSIYAGEMGLSDSEIGWVYAAFGLSVLVSPPLYTLLADRWLSNRQLIGCCYGLGVVTLAGLVASGRFSTIFAAHLMFALGFTALIPLMDGLTFATIGNGAAERATAGQVTERPVPYRAIRVWGSYGWLVPGMVFPFLLLLDWSAAWVSTAAIITGAAFCLMGVLALPALPRGGAVKPAKLPTLAAFRAMRQPQVAAFVATVFIFFTSISVYYTFYPRYLQHLGLRVELVGLVTNLGVVVEVFCMAISGWLLTKIGLRGLLLLGGLSIVARMVMLAVWPNYAVAIGTQIFHGPTVLVLYLLPPMYLNLKAEDGYRNSIQGLYHMLCLGVARLVGSVAGGHVSDAAIGAPAGEATAAEQLWGLQVSFGAAAGLCAVACVGLMLLFRDAQAERGLQDAPKPQAA